MQKEYLEKFLDDFAFPNGAKDALFDAYEQVRDSVFFSVVESYKSVLGYDECLANIRALATERGVNEYTLILLYLVYIAEELKEEYIRKAIDLQIWHDSVLDLKYKALDCMDCCGVWGTKEAQWHKQFFELKRFGFGKLQFNVKDFANEYDKDGIRLGKQSFALAVHIPQTGEKLDYESVQSAYKKAVPFFRKYFPEVFDGKPVVFFLKSWMLFDKLRGVLKPQSNFMLFCKDFDVFRQDIYDDYSSVWRVFHKPYTGELSSLPQDTCLQRAYAKWIEQGEKIGYGWGVYCPPYAR